MRRKRGEWRENVSILGVVLLGSLVGFPAAIFIHANARQWEAPAIFASLGLGVLSGIWYWRARRFRWVAAILATMLFLFSFGSAILYRWVAQAAALYVGGVFILLVVIFINGLQLTHHVDSMMRAVGEEVNGDPLFRREVLFRDDGQRIVVYPQRHRLIINCAMLVAILAAIGFASALRGSTDALVLWILLGLFACILIYGFLANLYRLVIRKASLVVGPDGILDDGSLIWSGVGLLRWDEILSVTPTTRSSGSVTYHYLDILVSDFPAIRRRLSLLKRFALRNTNSGMSQLLIPQWMLETPIDDLAAQIDQYVETHAPPGWRGIGTADDVPAPDNGAEA